MEFKFILIHSFYYTQCLYCVIGTNITSWDVISNCGLKIGVHVKAGELGLFYNQQSKYPPCTVTVQPMTSRWEYNRNILLLYFTKFDLAACDTEHVNLFDGLGSFYGASSGEDDAVPLNTRPLCGTNDTLLKDDQHFKALSGAFQIVFQRLEPSMLTSRFLLKFVAVHEVNQTMCSKVTGYHHCKSKYCVPSEYACSNEHKLCDQPNVCDGTGKDGDGNGEEKSSWKNAVLIAVIVVGSFITVVVSLVGSYRYCRSNVKRDVKNCCTKFGRNICQPFRICGLSFGPLSSGETMSNTPTAGCRQTQRSVSSHSQNTHYQDRYSRDGTTDHEMVMFVDGLPPATPVFPPSYTEATSSLNSRAVPSISSNVSPQLHTYSETTSNSQIPNWLRSNVFPQLSPSSILASQRISNNDHTSQISTSLSTIVHPGTDVAPPSYEESISQTNED